MVKVDVAATPYVEVQEAGARDVQVQWLLAPAQGAPNFALRRFVLKAGGQTPWHAHPWEHEVYILAGSGVVVTAQGETPLQADCAVLVTPGESHCFRAGAEGLQFLCLVPNGEATAGH